MANESRILSPSRWKKKIGHAGGLVGESAHRMGYDPRRCISIGGRKHVHSTNAHRWNVLRYVIHSYCCE
jgi:hypothetical protein